MEKPRAKFNFNGVPSHWFANGVALFFTIQGYSLIRASAGGEKVRVLVGLEDSGEDKLKRVLLK